MIFSVHDSDQTKQEIRAAGAHGFVSKGKDSHDLLRVVRDVLNTNIQAASATSIHFKLQFRPAPWLTAKIPEQD